MDTGFIIEKFILVAVIFGISLVIAMYSTYAERKVAAYLQDRLGPDRAVPLVFCNHLRMVLKCL